MTAEVLRRHVIDLDDFARDEIDEILQSAEAMKEVLGREIKQVPALRGRTVVNMFFEESTRTRISFELAARNLSAGVVNFTAKGSSVEKGESLIDTIRTLQALGADMVVLRHPQAGAPFIAAQHFHGAVINAGDGRHAHPSQALLDLFTIRERLGQIGGVKVAIVGDLIHSRVVRSNLWGLTKMGAKVVLCGPPTLIGSPADWHANWPDVQITYNLNEALAGCDVVMALRLQKERQQGGMLPSLREYRRFYALTAERLAALEREVLVLHPGPMNEGVEIMPDVASAPNAAIEDQVTNGVAVRMALLYRLAQ